MASLSISNRKIVIAAALTAATAAVIYSSRRAYSAQSAAAKEAKLSPDQWQPFKVMNVKKYNHNTFIYEFELSDKKNPPTLPTASFILTKANINGKEEVRPYTPIDQHTPGKLILMLKRYENGIMSKHITDLKVGDSLEMQGPIPKLEYKPNKFSHVGLIAGGSGITPALQILEELARNPTDKTKATLIFGNVGPKDILLKERLDALAKKDSRIKIVYTIDKAEAGWTGEVGHINEALIKKYLPGPENKDVMITVCGPPPLYKALSGFKNPDFSQGPLDGLLKKMGYNESQVYKF